jgi:hypothetical protein
MWDVEYGNAFEAWWNGLDAVDQEAVCFLVELLSMRGPKLEHPYATAIYQSQQGTSTHELRLQLQGRPLRILYAIDPDQCSVMLLGLS